MSIHLTDNQRMLMNGFNTEPRPFSFWDGGFVSEGSGTYLSEFVPEVAHIIGKPESSATRTIHDLEKKGIFTIKDVEAEDPIMSADGKTMVQEGKPADHWVELTDAGVELISDLRIEEDEAMLDMDLDEEPVVETMVTKAARKRKAELDGQKEAAQADIGKGKPGLRTSHAGCSHATHGKEGKIARAKCRRERAALAAKAEEKVSA